MRVIQVAWAGFIFASLLLGPAAQAQAEDPFAPRIAYGADPARMMTIVWSAPADTSSHRLEYGTTPDLGTEVRGTQRDLGDLEVWPVYVELKELEPGTEYYYKIRQGETEGAVHRFRTAPASSAGFSFVAWGDQSSPGGPEAAGDAPKRVTDLAVTTDAQFALILGDLSYAHRSEQWWNAYVAQVSAFSATRPFMTVPGNHDLEGAGPEGYRTRFRMPSGSEHRWYGFQYGNAFFLGLDTESVCNSGSGTPGRPPSSGDCELGVDQEQLDFIRGELSKARQTEGIDWIVVYHHFPIHSQGRHGGNALLQQLWRPIYEEFDVDLVLQAHDHLYLRSKPLVGGNEAAGGTTYIVAGTGGANLYQHGQQQSWEAFFQDKAHGITKIHVGAASLEGEFLSVAGEVLDSFRIEKQVPSAPTSDDPAVVPVAGVGWTLALSIATLTVRRR